MREVVYACNSLQAHAIECSWEGARIQVELASLRNLIGKGAHPGRHARIQACKRARACAHAYCNVHVAGLGVARDAFLPVQGPACDRLLSTMLRVGVPLVEWQLTDILVAWHAVAWHAVSLTTDCLAHSKSGRAPLFVYGVLRS